MSEDDARIEALLSRYRPVGPPTGLRARVLQTAAPHRGRWTTAAGWAIAASLILSFGLNRATERVVRGAAADLGVGRVAWTSEAEECAKLLDGEAAGRHYLAMALAAEAGRRRDLPSPLPATTWPEGFR